MQNDSHDRLTRPSSFDDITARIQSLRNILNSEHHISAEQQVALEALDQEEAHRRTARAMENSIPRTYSDEGYWESQSGPSTTSIARERRRPPRPGVRMDRQRERLNRLGRSEPLEQVDAPAAARLSPLHTSRTRHADVDVEPQSTREGRYPKRRKLNDGTAHKQDTLPEYSLTAFHSPCSLKMTLLESDIVNDLRCGNLALDKLNIHTLENKTVLRTRSKQCNIFMKHQGGWPFDLSRLLVKLPKNDHDTSPLQGMVFVALNHEDLISNTENYDSLIPTYHTYHHRVRRFVDTYRPSRDSSQRSRSPYRSVVRPRHVPEPGNPQWCSQQASEDSAEIRLTEGHRVSVESIPHEDEESSPTAPHSSQTWYDQEYSRRYYNPRTDSYRPAYDDDYSPPYYRADRTDAYSRSSAGPSDSEEEEEELLFGRMSSARLELREAEERQQAVLDRLQSQRERRSVRPARPHNWTEDEETSLHENMRMYREHHAGNSSMNLELSPRENSSRKRLPGPSEMLRGRAAYSDVSEGETAKKILPHAKFQVTKAAGGVFINFDPPIAGKYILIKLWTQCPNSTISLQNVVPFGSAGLRQIPDLEFR